MDSDNLGTLPLKNDTVKTSEEEAVIKQLFPHPPPQVLQGPQGIQSQYGPSPIQSNIKNSPPSKINWKLLGISIILFIALANPWIDNMLCKIPYCEGKLNLLGLKTLLFIILLMAANYFL